MELRDHNLLLRRFHKSDRDALSRLADSANVARYLSDRFPAPYTLQNADTWIDFVNTEERQCNFAMEWRGEFIGGIGLEPMADVHSGTAALGYWLGEPYWRKGLATRAVGLIANYAFDELLFIRLQALVYDKNLASARVLEKNHFVREGTMHRHVRKNGIIHDAVLYARIRDR